MARRKKDDAGGRPNSLPSQQDEADILAEAGAEPDEEGNLIVDEGKIRELGAVDAESIRANRRAQEYADNKRGHVPGVQFSTDDVLEKYEAVIKEWPPNTLDITVIRRTGTMLTNTITSRPRSGVELYEAIKGIHGQQGETEYEIKLHDINGRQYRGHGRITMPDTTPPAQQGQQPMTYPYAAPPPGYPPPPPPQQPTFGYPPPQQAQPQPQMAPQQPAPPTVQIVPQPFDPMAMMRQMFEMFQKMQSVPPQPVLQPPQPQAPAPAVMPQMPSPQAGPAEMMVWMQQMFQLVQQMQAHTTAPQPVQVQQPAPVAPAPVQPPPSSQLGPTEMLGMMESMFKMVRQMQPEDRGRGPYRGPFQGPRPGYDPQDGRGQSPYPDHRFGPSLQQQQQPPPRPPTATEQFGEALKVLRTASSMVNEVNGMFPGQPQQEVYVPEGDDESPVRVVDTGAAKLLFDKKDGGLRGWETILANLDKGLKWAGEQREAIQKANDEKRLRQQRPQEQLPPGYVEVHPGYRPPPGFVAVPLDPQYAPQQPQQQWQQEEELPPPPAEIPPPIQAPRRTWSIPES